MKIRFAIAIILLAGFLARAQLAVTVAVPKLTGQKIVVSLAITNKLSQTVESARAVCFLLDDRGKMIGQTTKWVIGQNKKSLEPKEQAKFNFVITAPHALVATNLTAKVFFSRLILQGGKQVNTQRNVTITPSK